MTDEAQGTAQKQQKKVIGKPFVKGDKRINRGGRPKSFDALRKLAQKIAGELPEESDVTRVTEMLIEMSKSKNPSDRALFLAYAFGKPKEELDIKNSGETKVIIEYSQGPDTPATSGTTDSKEQPEKV